MKTIASSHADVRRYCSRLGQRAVAQCARNARLERRAALHGVHEQLAGAAFDARAPAYSSLSARLRFAAIDTREEDARRALRQVWQPPLARTTIAPRRWHGLFARRAKRVVRRSRWHRVAASRRRALL